MSSRKRERDDPDEPCVETILDKSTTAASACENPGDQDKVFSVIKGFDKIFGKSKHRIFQRYNEWPKRIVLRFLEALEKPILLSHIEHLITEGGGYIIDLEINWQPSYLVSVTIATPGDDKREPIYPFHSPQFFRETEFKRSAKEIMTNNKTAMFKTWKEDLETLDALVTIVYNCEADLNFVTCGLEISPKHKKYLITFHNLNKISYSFIEYLMTDDGRRIDEISFDKSGMTVTVLSHEVNRTVRKITMRKNALESKLEHSKLVKQ